MRSLILLTVLGGVTTAAFADAVPRPSPKQKVKSTAARKSRAKVTGASTTPRKTAPAKDYYDTKVAAPVAKAEPDKVAANRQ